MSHSRVIEDESRRLTGMPRTRARNLSGVAELSRPSFDLAHERGLMGVACHTLPSRRIRFDGTDREAVDYTRCGYLGLDSHPQVLAAAQTAMDRARSVHFSVARTRLSAAPLVQLERTLASLFRAMAVVVFPTVAAANMGALPLLAAGLFTAGRKPLIAFDRFAHVTLQYHIPVLREETDVVVIEHNDLDHLERLCRSGRQVAYVGDGAYSMGGAAPVRALQDLQARHGLFLYLDDAHGISVVGERGEGFVRSQLDALGDRTIIAASLGKGYGASGGLLMLGARAIEQAVRRYAPTYGFSCAPNMAAVGAALGSADIHRTGELRGLQQALRENLALFDRLVPTETQGSALPIRIVRIGDEIAAIDKGEALLRQGHYASAVFFPTVPRGQAGLRMAVTAAHRPADLQALGRLLAKMDDRPAGAARAMVAADGSGPAA